MKAYSVEHVIECSPEAYWSLWLDPTFGRALLLDGLGFVDCAIEPVRIEGHLRLRDMTATPRASVPRALRRAVGDKLTYAEAGRLDTREGRWSYTVSLPAFSAFRGSGEVTLAPLPDGRCTRTSRIRFEVGVPMIGGRVEATAIDNARAELDRGAAFVNRWLARG